MIVVCTASSFWEDKLHVLKQAIPHTELQREGKWDI
jgi:hypothetical protein